MVWLRSIRGRLSRVGAYLAATIISFSSGCAAPTVETRDGSEVQTNLDNVGATVAAPISSAPSDVTATSTAHTMTFAVPPTPCEMITSFDGDQVADYWFIVNDGVMGGRSSSGATFTGDELSWSGEIDTDGGGFASLRAGLAPGLLARTGAVRVAARHDGRAYEILLGTGANRPTYYGALRFGEPDAAGISVARVDFDTLEARIFGTPVEAGPFRADLATTIGVILADGTNGSFALDLVRIDRCST